MRSRNNIPWLLLAAHMVLLEIASAQPLVLPHWSGSFDWEGQSYSYTLIGASPAQGSSTTHIPVNVIPVRVLFSDGSVFDPMDPFLGSTALDFALHSPIFQPTSWTAGSVDLGTTQFGDAIQRANFWNYVSTVAPDYHVLLDQPKILSPILLTLPPQSGLTVSENGTLRGILDYNWLRQSISSMAGTLDPASLTIFLVKQVSSAASIQNPSSYNCSFHSSLSQANAVATYMFVSIYDEAHCNGDVHSFSHEVAEWLNDPLVTNVVPAWSIGADEGTCSNVLEAGDPLEPPGTKTTVPVTLNGVHYTLQETAFLSYFARAPVSSSVNGWYTFQNSYPGYSPPCAITSGYNFRFYDYAGAAGTAIMAINGQDEFAGSFYDGATNWAFAAGGPNIAAAVLKPFNAAASVATGLNDRGEVVGYYSDGTDTYGFIYSAGSFQIVQFPIGALSTVPLSINDADQIVGYYIDLSGKRHGFMLANGSYTTIDPMIAGANQSWLTGIDDSGRMTGLFLSAESEQPTALVGTGGQFAALALPSWAAAASSELPLTTNWGNEGPMAGTFYDDAGYNHGYVSLGGSWMRIDPPLPGQSTAVSTYLEGVNASGALAGFYIQEGVDHGFIAYPRHSPPPPRR